MQQQKDKHVNNIQKYLYRYRIPAQKQLTKIFYLTIFAIESLKISHIMNITYNDDDNN